MKNKFPMIIIKPVSNKDWPTLPAKSYQVPDLSLSGAVAVRIKPIPIKIEELMTFIKLFLKKDLAPKIRLLAAFKKGIKAPVKITLPIIF